MKIIPINGKLEKHVRLPKSIKRDDRLVFNLEKLSKEELVDLGIYDLITPSYDKLTQKLGEIVWKAEEKYYTYEIVDIDLSDGTYLQEQKEGRILRVNNTAHSILSDTDYVIVKSIEKGETPPQNIVDERQAVRDVVNAYEVEVNNCTTLQELANIEFPFTK